MFKLYYIRAYHHGNNEWSRFHVAGASLLDCDNQVTAHLGTQWSVKNRTFICLTDQAVFMEHG